MFIGHFAPALAAATHPRAPKLATLFIAAQLAAWWLGKTRVHRGAQG